MTLTVKLSDEEVRMYAADVMNTYSAATVMACRELLEIRHRFLELEQKLAELKQTIENLATACHCEKDREFIRAFLNKDAQ